MDFERIVEFAGNHPVLVAALLAMIFLVIFHEVRRKTQGSSQVSPSEAVRMINDGAHVVDVRDTETFRSSHIVNARNAPADTLKNPNQWLSKQRKKTLLLVCDNGSASARGVAELQKQGFEKVYSLRGGLTAWKQENLPLTSEEDKKKGERKGDKDGKGGKGGKGKKSRGGSREEDAA